MRPGHVAAPIVTLYCSVRTATVPSVMSETTEERHHWSCRKTSFCSNKNQGHLKACSTQVVCRFWLS